MTHRFHEFFENWLSYNLKCVFQQNNLHIAISNSKNLSKCNAQLNFAEIRTLNCNSTNFQKIREIDVCHMPI